MVECFVHRAMIPANALAQSGFVTDFGQNGPLVDRNRARTDLRVLTPMCAALCESRRAQVNHEAKSHAPPDLV